MSLEEDLKAKTLALISQQMTEWAVEIERQITSHQAAMVQNLDDLRERIMRYDEKISEPDIEAGIAEVASLGTGGSKGTKVFTLTGTVNNVGLIEVPMGTTLQTIVYDIGGGIPEKREFKAVQIGGPSGACLPTSLLNIEVDFDSLDEVGAMMGSGGLVVINDSTCMVDTARFFTDFSVDESCGKCVPCRVGMKVMLNILHRIIEGKGEMEDIERLERLGQHIKETSHCGLGKTAPNPVLSTIRYFRT